jgi:uncharacterized repeat protein (TIGR01451 family)
MGKVGTFGRLSRVAVLVAIGATLIGVPLAASANPDVSGFELDGNAVSNGAADWDAQGSPLDSTGIIGDPTGTADRGFTTGGSKDTNDVSQWKWADGKVTPDKDNIAHAYAAVYAEQGNLILYFGQDRVLDKNGDANVGFWFTQNAVGLNGDGSFSGTHADGDILVQSEFTNGGDVSGVQIYKWQSGGLTLVSNQAECTGGKLGTTDACAIVNKSTISTSWAGSITTPYFFEGGLNLSALFPQSVPCFSTFLTSTRTSQSEDAQLKDFAMGDIDTCGSITIKKVTSPGGAGPFSFTTTGTGLSSFDLSGGGEKDFAKLQPSAYSVTESTLPSAWALDSLSCTSSGPGTSTSTAGATANITLGFIGDVVCTYTNKRQPLLTLVKNVVNDNGGAAAASAWTLAAAGTSGSFSGTANTSAVTAKTVAAGVQYTLSESGGPAGYDASNWDCGGGSFSSPNKVTLAMGDDVTCTITNNDKAPSLTLVKQVVNDNGGTAAAADFTLSASGPTSISGPGGATSGSSFTAGTYSLSETALSGYTAGAWSCTGSGSQNGASIALALGQSATCTIVNNDQPGTLVVIKHVVKDSGGSASASAWTMHVAGPTASSFPGAESPGTSKQVNAGAYKVTESGGPAGYALTYSGNCDEDGDVAVPVGQTRTCTLTNDDQPATLHVKKVVVNDNGGTKQAQDFSFQVNGGGAQAFEADGQNDLTVNSGTYDVTEPASAGYATSYQGCANIVLPIGGSATCIVTNDDSPAKLIVIKHVLNDNGGTAVSGDFSMTVDDAGSNPPSFPGAESPGTQVSVDPGSYSASESGPAGYQMSQSADCSGSIALGETKTCTVTNDDQAGTLVVVKHVVNDSGGEAAASDWAMNVAGPTPLSFAGAESPGTSNPVSAGAYKVTESGGPVGYALTYSGDCDADGDVTVPLGQTRTCTLVNDDEAATLVVVKHVVNDSGGTAVAQLWTMDVDGPTASSFSGSESPGTSKQVSAGGYKVTESGGPAGYTLSYSGDCDADGDVTLALGETKTCTLVNDDQAATLIVKKVVVNDNGGTKQARDFSFQVNGGQAQAFEVDGQNDLTVSAGTYNVVEPAVAGYTTTYQGCANILLALGSTATCTVTNNDVPRGQGSISVSKSAEPGTIQEPGGPVTFSVTITNTSADVNVTIDNVVDDKFGDLDDSGGNGCFDVPINLNPGEKVNCTFSKTITGVGGTSHVNVVTVTGHDPAGHTLTASDDAKVDITPRLIDLVIQKDASSPTPLNGIVNYTLTVINKGPDTATNVQLADPAPAGITYLTANPSQGTCNLSAAIVTCSLGTIAPGQTVTIAITARATTVGSHTNTATVTGSGGRETNPADNVDSAVTIVPAPLKPPVVKPKPEPQVCMSLTVSPKMITADGKPDRVTAKVTAGSKRMKGVTVRVSGAGVSKSAHTNGKGVATLRINPKKPGIITVGAAESNQKLCGPQRIGVVGVFLPPLTG